MGRIIDIDIDVDIYIDVVIDIDMAIDGDMDMAIEFDIDIDTDIDINIQTVTAYEKHPCIDFVKRWLDVFVVAVFNFPCILWPFMQSFLNLLRLVVKTVMLSMLRVAFACS